MSLTGMAERKSLSKSALPDQFVDSPAVVKSTLASATSSSSSTRSSIVTQQLITSSLTESKMDFDPDYKSNIGPRETYTRKSYSASGTTGGVGGRILKMTTEMGSSSVSGLSAAFSANAASAIVESREKEKKDMMELNDRLASYIEKVRFLEAQNRKLSADLDALRGRWGKDTSSIKNMYEGELAEARKLIDETAKNKAAIEVQIARLQEELAEYKRKWDRHIYNLITLLRNIFKCFASMQNLFITVPSLVFVTFSAASLTSQLFLPKLLN